MDITPGNPTTLELTLGLDRTLAWHKGASVRYLVADLVARSTTDPASAPPALNLALAIDVSGSMAGEKLAAARQTAMSVCEALGNADRLTLVSFGTHPLLILDTCVMDAEGRCRAVAAIRGLHIGGQTNVSGGWQLAADHLIAAMRTAPEASHRIVLLSDGRANRGWLRPSEWPQHASMLLSRGIITSAVGIGNGYAEALLGAMVEAGGGRLHDAEHASDMHDVVLGELRESRGAALQRTSLRVTVPHTLQVEVVGPWSSTVKAGVIEIQTGLLLPDHARRIVLRLTCPAAPVESQINIGATASGFLPDGSDVVQAPVAHAELRFVRGQEIRMQERDVDRSLAALQAWHAAVLRQAVGLNRADDHSGVRTLIEGELHWMSRYAHGLPNAVTLLEELHRLLRRAGEDWGERTRKDVFAASSMRGRYEDDLRSAVQPSLLDRLTRGTL